MTPNEMTQQMTSTPGFIAALDQSGGSTPNTLKRYGIDDWKSEEEMFDLIHKMRTRIITSQSFSSEHIIGAILFKITLENQIEGVSTSKYLKEILKIVPFLKIDNGLDIEWEGVLLMKPIPELDDILDLALAHGVFGTKMRSVINQANGIGISRVVSQQFDLAEQIIERGLIPIIEPEVSIDIEDKSKAENMLLENLTNKLDALSSSSRIILKLTLPEIPNLYASLVKHTSVMRVVALSGGYSLKDATTKLKQNGGMIASFSRALTSGLLRSQTKDEFSALLSFNVQQIYDSSVAM